MDILQSLTNSLHKAIDVGDISMQAQIQLKIAQYFYNLEQFVDAKVHLTQVQKLNPNYPNVNYYLGLVELNLQNDSDAKKYFKKELSINPNHQFSKQILEKFQIKSNYPILTLILIFISIITFFISNQGYETFLKFGASNYNLSFFSLFSSIFFHVNIFHLIFNSLFLLMFGLFLEKAIGSVKFLTIFLISGIVGNLLQVFLSLDGIVLGMSSAIFGIFGAVVAKEPLLDFKIFGLFKIPLIILFGIVFLLQYLASSLITIQNLIFGDIAHLFGFMAGLFIMVVFNPNLIYIFYNWLVISAGFVIIGYSSNSLIFNFTNNNFVESLVYVIFTIFSFLLIIWAYTKLKQYLVVEEDKQ